MVGLFSYLSEGEELLTDPTTKWTSKR